MLNQIIKFYLLFFLFINTTQVAFPTITEVFNTERFRLLYEIDCTTKKIGTSLKSIQEGLKKLNDLESKFKQLCNDHWDKLDLTTIEERIPTIEEFESTKNPMILCNIYKEIEALTDKKRKLYRDLKLGGITDITFLKDLNLANTAYENAIKNNKAAQALYKEILLLNARQKRPSE